MGDVLAQEGKVSEDKLEIESNWVLRMQQVVDVMDGFTMFRTAFAELHACLTNLELRAQA